jgi:hypothetical protein
MSGGEQKDIVLILARELASNIATPMLIFDTHANLVFFNEPAEVVLGTTFSQTGEVSPEGWAERWKVTEMDGAELELLDSPLARALADEAPGHHPMRVLGLDGVWRGVEATVYPLFARAQKAVGAVAVFWEVPCT